MIKLNSYTDENVFENAKKYIAENFKKGQPVTTSFLQRTFWIPYNKSNRILNMLHEDGIIKLDAKRLGPARVL